MESIRSDKSNYSDNDLLFEFLRPNENDLLKDLKSSDLQELLYRLDKYYLELRTTLGFDEKVTFGLELEFENAMRKRIENKMNEIGLLKRWPLVNDGSLTKGAEINSPILKDEISTWLELKDVCSVVSNYAVIGKNSGGHIHIGTQVLGGNKDSWLNFIRLWSVYENIIFRFLYGEKITGRKSISEYAKPISRKLWRDYEYLKTFPEVPFVFIKGVLNSGRYQSVNFGNIYMPEDICRNNTLEFRSPNGTLEPVVWQNNVNLLVNILKYSKSCNFNEDLIMKRRRENIDKYSYLEWYDEIYLDQSLELADMLFDNNLDKIYFLRQYLKSFQTGRTKSNKQKTFIKK